jgi:hypothetical protein
MTSSFAVDVVMLNGCSLIRKGFSLDSDQPNEYSVVGSSAQAIGWPSRKTEFFIWGVISIE